MPAAAVIPAPIAYIKVVAVKKLVVGYYGGRAWWRCVAGAFVAPGTRRRRFSTTWRRHRVLLTELRGRRATFTLKKLECSKQAHTKCAWIP